MRLGLYLGMAANAGLVSLDPDVVVLISRMSTPPSAIRAIAMSNLVKAHKESGVWATLDCYQRRDAHYAGGCLIDWVNSSRTAVLIDAPTFTVNRQYTTDGVNDAIDSQFKPSTANLSSLNDSAFHTMENKTTSVFAFLNGARGTNIDYTINGRNDSTQIYGFINHNITGSNAAVVGADNYGLQTTTRKDSANGEIYLRGTLRTTTSNSPSSILINNTLLSCGYYGYDGTLLTPCISNSVLLAYGKQLTSSQALAFWGAEEIYLRAIGNWSEPVTGWGDSLTAGAGSGGNSGGGTGSSGLPPNDYLTQLQPFSFNAGYPYRRTINGGISGETSTQIKTRMLNASGYDGQQRVHIIWAGRNNFTNPTTVKADIATMVAQAESWSGKYLVIQIPPQNNSSEYTGATNRITLDTLNSDLSELYGSKFVTILGPNKITLDGNGIPNSSFRYDVVHFSAAGNLIVSTEVQSALVANGWN